MNHAKGYLFLLGGFTSCLLLGAAIPFLPLARKILKGAALAIPLLVLAGLVLGGQAMTNRYWVAIVPYLCCGGAIGADVFWTIRERRSGDLVFQGFSTLGCGWSCWISLLALDSGFMGANC